MKERKKKDLYTLGELSKRLGIKKEVLKRWCERGEIACRRDVGPNGVVYAVRQEDVGRVVEKVKKRKKQRDKVLTWTSGLAYVGSVICIFGFIITMFDFERKTSLYIPIAFFVGAYVVSSLPVIVNEVFFPEFKEKFKKEDDDEDEDEESWWGVRYFGRRGTITSLYWLRGWSD